jgi:2-amino-4-hydroxy-6-hydroxymethyldihydropteridine diphosphokinase
LWQIELACGRKRTGKLSDRTLDLDLLLYEDFVSQGDILHLPHPRLHERAFVLGPLVELIPREKHPILKRSFLSLWDALPEEEKARIKIYKRL